MAGSLEKATAIIKQVAETYVAERVAPTDFYEQRDAFLKEDTIQGTIRQVAMYGSLWLCVAYGASYSFKCVSIVFLFVLPIKV